MILLQRGTPCIIPQPAPKIKSPPKHRIGAGRGSAMLARPTDQEAVMPVLKLKDAEIHYEEYGKGYPVLLFAPGLQTMPKRGFGTMGVML